MGDKLKRGWADEKAKPQGHVFNCTGFYLVNPEPSLLRQCSPEELHRRRQQKYDELWGLQQEEDRLP